ncbi:hypothetical protein Pcinc_027408 [Petrolisthes cinctipes]|uniref:Uncharacterized protein n=1 Tax=Petrolisthes cinctipes TaxID=88211 RepID=A0AAE1F580_PETCI|nr:hypothetical protein Pcinc_027408 [Petrolisthes cinctipes]
MKWGTGGLSKDEVASGCMSRQMQPRGLKRGHLAALMDAYAQMSVSTETLQTEQNRLCPLKHCSDLQIKIGLNMDEVVSGWRTEG